MQQLLSKQRPKISYRPVNVFLQFHNHINLCECNANFKMPEEERRRGKIHCPSHGHHHKHGDECSRRRRHREHSHHRHSHSYDARQTRFFFPRSQNNHLSVSFPTDHVSLAANLSQAQGMSRSLIDNCYRVLDRLRQDRQTVAASSYGRMQRGPNYSNLADVPQSTCEIKPSEQSLMATVEHLKKTNMAVAHRSRQEICRNFSDSAQMEKFDISLYCPLSRSRIVLPVRGRNCSHVHCFDGESYLRLMWKKKPEKWKCPICRSFTPCEQLIVDGLFVEVLQSVSKECRTVSFTPDGLWTAKEYSCSLPESENNLSQQKSDVVDLTFDSPNKMSSHNEKSATDIKMAHNNNDNNINSNSNNSHPHKCQVIDLTLSP